jgi:hypothetical protein
MQPEEDYYQLPYVSQSSLKVFMQSPMDYKHSFVDNGPSGKGTSQMDLGSLVHTLLLEPETFGTSYMVYDEADRANPAMTMAATANVVWKGQLQAKARERGLSLIKKPLFDQAMAMVNAVKAHALASSYLFPTPLRSFSRIETELFIQWSLPESDVQLKSKLDKVLVDEANRVCVVLDYKTTSANNLKDFAWSVKKYGYDTQQAFYEDAVRFWLAQEYPDVSFTIQFYFIPQRVTVPYQVLGVISLHRADIDAARHAYIKALQELEGCLHTNVWQEEDVIILRLSGEEPPSEDDVQLP